MHPSLDLNLVGAVAGDGSCSRLHARVAARSNRSPPKGPRLGIQCNHAVLLQMPRQRLPGKRVGEILA